METKFEEVAHLYVGSETRVDLKSKPFGSNECEVIFQGIDFCTAIVPYYRLVAYSPNLKDCIRSESLWLDGSYFKPILRPLSDITKDELSTLWSVVFTREFNGVIHKHKANDTGRGSYAAERYVMSSGVERLGVEFDGNIWADSDLSVWRHNKHKITAYLLSKHFDLFGLIESGESIDKTTLK